MKFEVSNIDTIADVCASTPVNYSVNKNCAEDATSVNDSGTGCSAKVDSVKTEHSVLLQKLLQINPDLSFKHVLTRGGWHRTGGVISRDGERISDKLQEWVETESSGSINKLLDKYLDAGFIVTTLLGKTHYFTAQTGPSAYDFIQLEVEEVQEVEDHYLFSSESLPDDIEDVIEPSENDYSAVDKLEQKPVGEPRYIFRRITAVNDFLQLMSERIMVRGNKYSSIRRFMQDWDRSSSKDAGSFCDYWILSMQEYTDAYGEPIMQAKPISTYDGQLSLMKLNGMHRGSELARLIHGFDHEIGYPMAWYFFMLSHSEVPHKLAEAIHKDLMGAYDYLPVRDLKVLKDWSANPYGI